MRSQFAAWKSSEYLAVAPRSSFHQILRMNGNSTPSWNDRECHLDWLFETPFGISRTVQYSTVITLPGLILGTTSTATPVRPVRHSP